MDTSGTGLDYTGGLSFYASLRVQILAHSRLSMIPGETIPLRHVPQTTASVRPTRYTTPTLRVTHRVTKNYAFVDKQIMVYMIDTVS